MYFVSLLNDLGWSAKHVDCLEIIETQPGCSVLHDLSYTGVRIISVREDVNKFAIFCGGGGGGKH